MLIQVSSNNDPQGMVGQQLGVNIFTRGDIEKTLLKSSGNAFSQKEKKPWYFCESSDCAIEVSSWFPEEKWRHEVGCLNRNKNNIKQQKKFDR